MQVALGSFRPVSCRRLAVIDLIPVRDESGREYLSRVFLREAEPPRDAKTTAHDPEAAMDPEETTDQHEAAP